MSNTSTGNGKVVVNRAMSLDGFIAAPGHAMDWGAGRQLADFAAPDEFREIAAATGAMLVGRRTYEVGKRMTENPNEVTPAYDGGAEFVLTHEPPDPPDPAVTFLTGDIGEAVATALRAAGGKNLEILGADSVLDFIAIARSAWRSRTDSFSVSDFNWPQAARMSRPRGVRTGEE